MPLLTLLSFYVTEPLHAFCSLFNNRHLFDADLDTNLVAGKAFLMTEYPVVDFMVEDYLFVQKTPVGLISEEQFNFILRKSKDFPLSMPADRFQKDRLSLEKALLTSDLQSSFDLLASSFQPMAVHYNFTDFAARETGIVYNLDKVEINGAQAEIYLAELAKLKDTTLSLISFFNKNLPKTCHHQQCPFYDFGLCHRWNAIPMDYHSCAFPSWFAANFDKEIVPGQRLLKHLDEAGKQSFIETLEKLQARYQGRLKWQYTFDEETAIYDLVIFKKTVQELDIIYAASFLEMLASRDGVEKIANKVSFAFDGYEDAESELFEIKEVAAWLRCLKVYMPELFFYINFDSEITHNNYMIYIFIEHKIKHFPDGTFELDALPEDWNCFVENELLIFKEFCSKNSLDFNHHIMNTYSSFIS